MGVMRVLTQDGDIRVEWDPEDEESVARAAVEFERLRVDGYEFFESVGPAAVKLTVFDPGRATMLAVPGVQSKKDRASGSRSAAMAGGPSARTVGWR